MIEELTKGEAPSLMDTDKANELIRAINAIINSEGKNGIQVDQNQDGSLVIFPSKGGALDRKYHPFQVTEIGEDVCIINGGLVNGVLPNSLSVDIDAEDLNYIFLEIDADAEGVSAVELKSDGSPPEGIPWEKNGVNTKFQYLIAIVNKGELTSQITCTNLFFKLEVAHEIPKDTVAIGEYPNDIYYTWCNTVPSFRPDGY